MKTYIAVAAIVALLCVTPFQSADISKLAPVEVVWLAEEDGQILLVTDTEDMGRGADVMEALSDMKATATGTIFLDTADYLIVEVGAEKFLDQAADVLRPSCMLCRADQMPDLKETAAFFSVHKWGVTLLQWQNNRTELPLFIEKERRFAWNES